MIQFFTLQKSILVIIGLLAIIAGTAKFYGDRARREQMMTDKFTQDVHDKWQKWIKK